MPELRSQADLEEALRTVERDKHGVVVLSRFGFAIREYEGKRYVVALTKEEAEQALNEKGITIRDDLGNCFTPSTAGYCVQASCTRNCNLVWSGGAFTCICSY
jgi:hypothetical protein